ncbi:MAG: DUF1631 domain-containing protein [Pseudomonadota bacterium]
MSQVKVVELNAEGRRSSKLPPVAHSIRQQAKKQLSELVQSLFNNTDDALFEMADRSKNDQHQEMYFDAMRLIRLHRKTIASRFMSAFYTGFEDIFSNSPVTVESPEETTLDDAEYTLLDQDELEMTVAVSGIVSKVTSQFSLAIMHLTKRLDALAKHQSVCERNNPLGPQILSTNFAEALEVLEVDIKIRIILLKLFERFVMERLAPIYEAANLALIDAGVMVDLKNKPKRANRAPASPRPGAAPATGETADDGSAMITSGGAGGGYGGPSFAGTGFASVQRLLAEARGSGALGATGGVQVNLPQMASNELVEALNQIQATVPATPINAAEVPPVADLHGLVLAHTADSGAQKSMAQTDDDTVNFIGMLFDYILNDRNLAIPMKALIGRLQIPLVKLAILDKSFFEKTAHPARALLNELSSAGIGWSSAQELKRDALYNKIESVVLRVLNEFSSNPDIFTELLEELREFVTVDSKRSVLVEQRVREAESGKATTNKAKLQVQALINQKACGLRLPSEAGKFISDTWSKVLTLRWVKHGESSEQWMEAVQTLDDLLWALQPLSSQEDVDERRERAPTVVSCVHSGMLEVTCTEEETTTFTQWLGEHLEQLSENDMAYIRDDERPESDIALEPVEEIILTSVDTGNHDAGIAPEFIGPLNNITEGTWVEIEEQDKKVLRCKLATITQPGNNYVFVNRRGMKVVEKNRVDLAILLKDKQLRIIDESQVFDRALQSVIGNLRAMQRERATT